MGTQGPAGPQGNTGPQGPAGPQGVPGLSGYQVATVTVNVNLAGQVGSQNIVVNCPGTTRVLSAFINRMPAGVRQAFPPGVAWSGWVSGAGQYTFSLKNTNFGGYADAVEAGAVCANTN